MREVFDGTVEGRWLLNQKEVLVKNQQKKYKDKHDDSVFFFWDLPEYFTKSFVDFFKGITSSI